MNETIYVVVRETEEAEDFQVVEVLQKRAFKDKAKAIAWRAQLVKDFGFPYAVVPLTVE